MLQEEETDSTARVSASPVAKPSQNVPPCTVKFLFMSTYFCAIIGLNSPQSMYPTMQSDHIFTASDVADILGIQTLGTMSGKLFAGIFVDRVGSRKAYLLSGAGLAVCLYAMSAVSSKWQTAFVAFFVELLFALKYVL